MEVEGCVSPASDRQPWYTRIEMDSVTLRPDLVDRIVENLVREAQAGKIIFFGSHTRGEAPLCCDRRRSLGVA